MNIMLRVACWKEKLRMWTVYPWRGRHERKFPPHLVKACHDMFACAIGLRDGTYIEFESATSLPHGWIRLNNLRSEMLSTHNGRKTDTLRCECPDRGVDVRVSDIMYVVDAPSSS